MIRTYATGRMWPFRSASDLAGAARRAEAMARSLGWPTNDVDELSRVLRELGGNALDHAGGGTCRLEASPTAAEIIIEDLGGGCARTRIVFTSAMAAGPIAAAG
jgi:anti-sigma regulatory factor (Ser/Thr protein kinase)